MSRTINRKICTIIGNRIRAQRLLLGRTQDQVAKLVGLSVGQIRKYEMGESEAPAHTLLRLARALEASTDHLLGRDEREHRSATAETAALLADPSVAAILRRLRTMDAKARKRALMVMVVGEESRA